MQLNKDQVEIVRDLLAKHLKSSVNDFDEILDHYCTLIESEINKGYSFDKAFTLTFTPEIKGKIRHLEHKLSGKKQLRLKVLIAFSIAIMITLGLLELTNTKHEEIKAKEEIMRTKVLQEIDSSSIVSWPVAESDRISSKFGMRMHPIHKKMKFHKGIDIPADKGAEINAVSSGVVLEVGFDKKGYGHYLTIEHSKGVKTLYSQLSHIKVQRGDIIRKGQVIGNVGSSGSSTAPHLHFEVHRDGKKIDPLIYLKA